MSAKQDQLLPKKKFAFRSRKKETSRAAKPENDQAKVQSAEVKVQTAGERTGEELSMDVNSKTVSNKKQEKIELVVCQYVGVNVYLTTEGIL